MEWQAADELVMKRAQRDVDRVAFVRGMLRVPDQPIRGTHHPVMDSFFHSIWLQTWKRDEELGAQPALSSEVSDFYVPVFAFTLLIGTSALRSPTAMVAFGMG